MLADEEVAMVQRSGCNGYNSLESALAAEQCERWERLTSLFEGFGSGMDIFSRG